MVDHPRRSARLEEKKRKEEDGQCSVMQRVALFCRQLLFVMFLVFVVTTFSRLAKIVLDKARTPVPGSWIADVKSRIGL